MVPSAPRLEGGETGEEVGRELLDRAAFSYAAHLGSVSRPRPLPTQVYAAETPTGQGIYTRGSLCSSQI